MIQLTREAKRRLFRNYGRMNTLRLIQMSTDETELLENLNSALFAEAWDKKDNEYMELIDNKLTITKR